MVWGRPTILSLSDQYRCCCRKPSSYP